MGKGKIVVILFILLFGMAIPSLIVTGVLLFCSVDVTFGMVYGIMTLAFIVFSVPFLYKQLRKDSDLSDSEDDSDDGSDAFDIDSYVDDSDCNKYL